MATTRVSNRGKRGLAAAEQAFLAGRIEEPSEAAHDAYLRAPALEAAENADTAATRADEARTAMEALVGDQLPALAELLMPAGATAILSDPANALLIGDLL